MISFLFVDIPTYIVDLDEQYKTLLTRRLAVQDTIIKNRLSHSFIRGQINYSRGLLSIASTVYGNGYPTHYLVYSDPTDQANLYDAIISASHICISALTPTIHLALEIAEFAKKVNPTAVTIIGGPHAQCCSEEIIQHSAVDIVSVGDGIISISAIAQGVPLETIPQLYYKTPDGFVRNTLSKKLPFSSLLKQTYVNYGLLSHPPSHYAHNLRTQNGCPYGCAFCYESKSISHVDYSCVPLDTVIDEIHFLNENLQPNTLVHFSDPVFTINKQRTLELCNRIAQMKPHIFFSMDTRIDCIDDEIISALSTANILFYRFGLEDGDQNILSRTDKGINICSIFTVSNKIRALSPHAVILAYWMTGLPGTTVRTIERNATFIKKLIEEKYVDIIGNKLLVPYPGTEYASYPKKYGMTILTKDWKYYDRLSKPVYRLDTMSSDLIYRSFIFLEEVLVHSYEKVAPVHISIPQTSNDDSLDYVFFSYVSK